MNVVFTATGDMVAPGASATSRALQVAVFLRLVAIHMVVTAVLWIAIPVISLDYDAAVITSGSMQPGMRPGDVVLTSAPEDTTLRAGTIVRFRDDQSHVTHRISGHNPDGTYRTRGDANPSEDSSAVSHSQIDGTARMVIPAVGLPAVWLHQGRLLPAAAVFVLLALLLAAPAAGKRDARQARSRDGAGRRRWPATIRRLALLLIIVLAAPVAVQSTTAAWSSAHAASGTWSSATLAATAAVRAAGSCTSGAAVAVDWDVVDQTIHGYDLYRKADLGSYQLLTSVDAATITHTDATITTGVAYTYAVVTTLSSWSSAMTESPTVAVTC